MNPDHLSIVILTKNGGPLFQEVLAGLFACEGISETEILIIDSGSNDSTLEYATEYPQIRIHKIPPSEFGHGKTRNLGARMTTGSIIVFLVQDATPATPDFLQRLTTPARRGRLCSDVRSAASATVDKQDRTNIFRTYLP